MFGRSSSASGAILLGYGAEHELPDRAERFVFQCALDPVEPLFEPIKAVREAQSEKTLAGVAEPAARRTDDAGEGFLRLSFANSLERLEEGFDRIERALEDEAFGPVG